VASRFDDRTAYAAINRFRLDDLAPHIFRTRDSGGTWEEIVHGIPGDEVVNSVREDPVRRGLLYAGTERGVYVSFNDGADWQSLRGNLPATSVRDLVVHGNDLVVGTHGRSFWILDDLSALRELAPRIATAPAHLFRPALAYRLRRNLNTDTPLPPEEPAGQNPPDGAILDYYLAAATAGPVTLEIFDARGRRVRRYSSADQPEPVDARKLAVPTYWVRPARQLSAAPGMHRFVWDLRYPAPETREQGYPISATYEDTPAEPLGPFVLPGRYEARLTVDGKTYKAPLTVKLDPRVKTSPQALGQQLALAQQVAATLSRNTEAAGEIEALHGELAALPAAAREGELGKAVTAFETRLAGLAEGRSRDEDSFPRLGEALFRLYEVIEGADQAPTPQAQKAGVDLKARAAALLKRWEGVREKDLADLNRGLAQAGFKPVGSPSGKRQEG
ncbi:MAG TPA: glycoside hydrolase, partial [Thermoanaerobaculia bacterium]|nr:glycoside hydrolase [Thermoanaerobaculia bacterium]